MEDPVKNVVKLPTVLIQRTTNSRRSVLTLAGPFPDAYTQARHNVQIPRYARDLHRHASVVGDGFIKEHSLDGASLPRAIGEVSVPIP